jgi:hypothetical protein
MTNIFQRIGNNLEKNKELRKKVEYKYWKLTSIERMEYDMHKKNIEEKNRQSLVTVVVFKILFYVTIGLGLYGLLFNRLDIIIDSLRIIWKSFFHFIGYAILLDFILITINSNNEMRDKKNLNKRFKLC